MEALSKIRKIIQGGMGVNISSWYLARTVSMLGQQGTLSGVELERIVARLLQLGDPGGHLRRVLSGFPFPHLVDKVMKAFFVEGGIKTGQKLKNATMISLNPSPLLIALIICSNFAFVSLAKEGHDNPISINYLEKVAIPHVYAITGAVLAGVDQITMGAGLPLQIPGLLNNLLEDRPVSYRIPIGSQKNSFYELFFDPKDFFGQSLPRLKQPKFIPIISSNLLAGLLTKKLPLGSMDGLVVELASAGGHNAPPRELTFDRIRDTGLPFWIGGSLAHPEKLAWSLEQGAQGIQVGSIFALCDESGLDLEVKNQIRRLGYRGELKVRTDLRMSPTGFPFKVLELPGTLAESEIFLNRTRVCNQGALVTIYEKDNGTFGYRCPSEPVEKFVAKGGQVADTIGRGCLCNGLNSAAGFGDNNEPILVTMGDDLSFLKSEKLMSCEIDSYTAKQALDYLLT